MTSQCGDFRTLTRIGSFKKEAQVVKPIVELELLYTWKNTTQSFQIKTNLNILSMEWIQWCLDIKLDLKNNVVI